ncbi:hypothetical protein AAY473_039927 [Plecturocebus cupreus]
MELILVASSDERSGSHFVSQAGMLWHDHGLLQPQLQSSHLHFLKMGFHHVGQAALEFLTSNDLPKCWNYRHEVSHCHPGWNAVVQSWLTATSASQVHMILLPSLPKTGFCHVVQAGVKLLGLSNLPASGSRNIGIIALPERYCSSPTLQMRKLKIQDVKKHTKSHN